MYTKAQDQKPLNKRDNDNGYPEKLSLIVEESIRNEDSAYKLARLLSEKS